MHAIYGCIDPVKGQVKNILEFMEQGLAQQNHDNYYKSIAALGVNRHPILKETQKAVIASNESGKIRAVVAGEIHNTREIRDWLLLKGHEIKTSCDAELVAHLYEEEGAELLRRLDGLHAFAVWDEEHQRLTAGLDRYGGIYRLFYIANSSFFAFSTTLKPLLHIPNFKRNVNETVLAQFFTTGHILPPSSLFQGVNKLAPGCVVVYENNRVSIRRVDWFESFADGNNTPADEMYHYFQNSIEKRLQTDKNIGLLLSGGLDSSTNVAIASSVSSQPVTTISAKIPHGRLDESGFAQIIADHFKTKHHEMIPNMEQAIQILPQIAWWTEEPLADSSAVPVYHVLEYAKGLVQGVISGDGPDHLFGRHYPLAVRRKYMQALIKPTGLSSVLRKTCQNGLSNNQMLSAVQRILRCSLFSLEQAYFDRLARPLWHTMGLEPIKKLFNPRMQELVNLDVSLDVPVADHANEYDRLAIQDFYVDGSFGVFQKIGRMADAHNIMVREPFFDRDVCDAICRLPQSHKVGGNTIQLMRSSGRLKKAQYDFIAAKVLPHENLEKQKGGFAPPTGVWLRKAIGNRSVKNILSPDLCDADYFDLNFIEQTINEHRSGQQNWGRLLYMILAFDLWFRIFISSSKPEPLNVSLNDLWDS